MTVRGLIDAEQRSSPRLFFFTPPPVLSGSVKPTQQEFNSIAVALNLTNAVSIQSITTPSDRTTNHCELMEFSL